MMNYNSLSNLRLANQQIQGHNFKNIKDLVRWMGAIQAQDFNMAKWAIGVRVRQSSDKMIEDSFNRGEILRTHLLRPTWHFVSSEDILMILQLTAPHIRTSMNSRRKELGLTEEIINKSNKAIETALSSGIHMTRDELIDVIKNSSIILDDPQAYYHLLLYAELEAIICSGMIRGKEQTYALFSQRVQNLKSVSRNEALYELANRYFMSHGPATIYDFIWWSGLPVSDARKSLELIFDAITSEKINSSEYWFSKSQKPPSAISGNTKLFLLPAYDEFIISYKDRRHALSTADTEKTISKNGIFRPVIIQQGQVIGTWKRTIKKNQVNIEPDFFKTPDNKTLKMFEENISLYKMYLS